MSSLKQQQDSISSVAETVAPESWSKVICPCCVSSEVEPLVLIQLAENVESNTKQWIMSMISAPNKAGGERRLWINPCKTIRTVKTRSTQLVKLVCGHVRGT